MRVFVTGATGFIGSAVTKDLIAAGHSVLGLCRSESKAGALAALGAEVFRGEVNDLDALKKAAAQADGIIHLAFNHDFSTFAQNCEDDRRVVEALGSALAGSKRPLIVTSGTAIAQVAPGELATEESPAKTAAQNPRAASEEGAFLTAARDVNVSVVRLPQVHDTRRQGLVTYVITIAREKGVCAYVGDGANRWAAGHISDVAPLYRLALEKAAPRAIYNAVGEEGVSMRETAETLGARLGLPAKSIAPEETQAHFGWLAMFMNHDMPASSAITQKALGWTPKGPGLIADLRGLELDA